MVLPSNALLQSGDQLPELIGQSSTGEPVNLRQLKGQAILLKIGTTWCPSCSEQAREINTLREELRRKQVTFVDVYVNESAAKVNGYYAANKLQPADLVIFDRGDIARKLNLYLIPRLLLIDQNQRVIRDGAPLSKTALQELPEKALTDK